MLGFRILITTFFIFEDFLKNLPIVIDSKN